MEGVVYKYTSPSGKVYIGQTSNEKRRRSEFFRINQSYGGSKMDNARKKYGVENFLYEVLFREEFDDLGVMAKTLNEKEMYYIKLFDSFKSGYNMNEGGAGNVGFEMPNDSRLKISENTKHTIKEKVHPDMAEKFLSHIECIEWENFLSQDEAKNIGMRIVNQDGIKGFHWTYDVFTKAVESLGGVVEEKPYYNSYALYVTACTIYSDHALSIAMDLGYKEPKEVPNEKMALSCYRKAVEKLKDIDGGFQVRKYFKGKMYADSPM